MMIKFLARGTGSAAAADYLTREQKLAPEQEQDQDQDVLYTRGLLCGSCLGGVGEWAERIGEKNER